MELSVRGWSQGRAEQAIRVKVKQRTEARCEALGRDGNTRASTGQRDSRSPWDRRPDFLVGVAGLFQEDSVCCLGVGMGSQGDKPAGKGTEQGNKDRQMDRYIDNT